MEEKDFSWSFKGQWEDDGGDSPGDPVFKNPPCDRGDPGLNPGQGTKIPHAAEQLNLCLPFAGGFNSAKSSRILLVYPLW